MTIQIDDRIERLNPNGGIATVWREIESELKRSDKESPLKGDYWLSTYYNTPPDGVTEVVMVYDFIADVYPHLRSQLDVVWKHQAIERAALVLCISPWVNYELKRLTGRSGFVIPMGTSFIPRVPKAASEVRRRYTLDGEFVLVVGRRGLYKNVRSLYQAWPHVVKHDDTTIVCVSGEQPTPLEVAFSQRNKWRWLNHVPRSDLEALYSAASAVVYPSFYEGFGLPVLDAFACGTPVLCQPATGMSFAQGFCETIDPYRPLSIAAGLNHVLAGGDKIKDRAQRAANWASQQKWSRTARAVREAIRGLEDA